MKEELKCLYVVKYKYTANKYVVFSSYVSEETIKEIVSKFDNRCDDIVSVEKVKLPSFNRYIDGVERNEDFVSIFVDLNIL